MLGNVRMLEIAVMTPWEAAITDGRFLWRFLFSFLQQLKLHHHADFTTLIHFQIQI
jgi:hypothetical protein